MCKSSIFWLIVLTHLVQTSLKWTDVQKLNQSFIPLQGEHSTIQFNNGHRKHKNFTLTLSLKLQEFPKTNSTLLLLKT